MAQPPRFRRVLAPAVLVLAWIPAARGASEKVVLPGLHRPVEVLRDRWGICHIYAADEHDLFFAQGYNTARDRLFQLELWRRQASGTLAEVLGRKAVNRDLGARLLRFRGDLRQELDQYHPRGEAIVTAFVDGINAYIDRLERESSPLPIEFQVLGIRPGRWTPAIVVSRHNGLFRNVSQELQVARLVSKIGGDRTRELLNLHPGRPRLKPDAAVNVDQIPARVLELYQASRAPVRFQRDDVREAYRGDGPPATAVAAAEFSNPLDPDAEGSNNWVVSGDRTFSRTAIMANDPHRSVDVPSLRYWVHLVAPGWNVIGAGEPALPGVAVGHNERGAWGFTIFPIDQEDLYIYETDPADPTRYRYRGGWETMRVERETIRVKGESEFTALLKFTRHGPVIHEDKEHHRAYALRAAWLEEGCAPYLASLRIDQARSWAEFRDACRHFRTPSENMVWADVDGHIGWQAVGLAPRRANWDGLVPVPGDGRHEWDGYLPVLELPHVLDPARGWFATANQDNLPRGYPHAVSRTWTDPFRFARIEEVLGSGRRFTLRDMMDLQQDELALPARSLVPLLRDLDGLDGKARDAADRLLAWNHVLSKDSVPAAIYFHWERALKREVREVMVPREARADFPLTSVSTERLIQWLTVPDGRFGPDPIAGRDGLLRKALAQALSELTQQRGGNMDEWRYGQPKLKHATIRHSLSDAVSADLRARLDPGPLPRGGYGHTVNSTSDNLNQATGATFRIIADAGDWDRSVGTSAPGQSGDPDSPHYRDLFAPWAGGRYFPVFYSRAKVESVTEATTTLEPAPAP
jgi:penicillin amidase